MLSNQGDCLLPPSRDHALPLPTSSVLISEQAPDEEEGLDDKLADVGVQVGKEEREPSPRQQILNARWILSQQTYAQTHRYTQTRRHTHMLIHPTHNLIETKNFERT